MPIRYALQQKEEVLPPAVAVIVRNSMHGHILNTSSHAHMHALKTDFQITRTECQCTWQHSRITSFWWFVQQGSPFRGGKEKKKLTSLDHVWLSLFERKVEWECVSVFCFWLCRCMTIYIITPTKEGIKPAIADDIIKLLNEIAVSVDELQNGIIQQDHTVGQCTCRRVCHVS